MTKEQKNEVIEALKEKFPSTTASMLLIRNPFSRPGRQVAPHLLR
jgi:hypothetical protein